IAQKCDVPIREQETGASFVHAPDAVEGTVIQRIPRAEHGRGRALGSRAIAVAAVGIEQCGSVHGRTVVAPGAGIPPTPVAVRVGRPLRDHGGVARAIGDLGHLHTGIVAKGVLVLVGIGGVRVVVMVSRIDDYGVIVGHVVVTDVIVVGVGRVLVIVVGLLAVRTVAPAV